MFNKYTQSIALFPRGAYYIEVIDTDYRSENDCYNTLEDLLEAHSDNGSVFVSEYDDISLDEMLNAFI